MRTLNNLILIGDGLQAQNILSLIGIYYPETNVTCCSWETAQTVSISNNWSYFVGIGDNKFRNFICNRLMAAKAQLVNLNFSNTVFSNTRDTSGNLFMPNSYLSPLATIGNFSIFNTCCVVEHHSSVGDACHIAPGATICGSVEIGNNCFIGANATVLPKTRIKSNQVVNAGSVAR